MSEKSNQLKPNIIMSDPSNGPAHFTMTRFAPLADGFAFYNNDYLVIINPPDVLWESPVVPRSRKTLEEHILYTGEIVTFITGWMAHPNGHLQMATPYGDE